MNGKRTWWVLLIGALVGVGLSTWLAPSLIVWYWNPPVPTGVLNCTTPIQWSISKFQQAQFIGLFGGAFIGLLLAFMFRPRHTSVEIKP